LIIKGKNSTITTMRTILTAMIFAVATLHGYAQNAAGNFLPRANDEVTLQQVLTAKTPLNGRTP
jgi:hypothetical protein